MATVIIHRSTDIYPPTDWHLSFQLVTFNYGNGQTPEHGYRFIWKRPGGPSKPHAARLVFLPMA